MQFLSASILLVFTTIAFVQAAPSKDINNIEVFISSDEALTDEDYPVQVSIGLEDSSEDSDNISVSIDSNEAAERTEDDR